MSVCIHGVSITDDCIHCIELKALRETVVEMRKDLARSLLSSNMALAEDLAMKYFDTWNEVIEAANKQ